MENNKTSIPVPPALADRIDGYLRQREQLEMVLRIVAEASAAALGVPDGWFYNPESRAFFPPMEPRESGDIEAT